MTLTREQKSAIAVGAVGVIGSVTLAWLTSRRHTRRGFGDSARDVLTVAADAFMENDIERGEKILDELPIAERSIARCTLARKKRYEKGTNWKGWKQKSEYKLYKSLVADPLYGFAPKNHAYTNVEIVTQRTTDTNDGLVTDWVHVFGELGPTVAHPEGEYRILVSNQVEAASHSRTLKDLGYDIVIPCRNVPLSGSRR